VGAPPGPRVRGKRVWFPPRTGSDPPGFVGQTRILTANGVVPLDYFPPGALVSILDAEGRWTTATVERFKPLPVWDLSLERGRARLRLRSTAEQLWPVTSAGRRLNGLQPLPFRTDRFSDIAGSPHWKLVTVNPSAHPRIDPEGVLHGIVFGDGARHRQPDGSHRNPYCQVYLCNDPAGCDSRELAPLFESHGFRPVVRDDVQQVRFHGLPEQWKSLPGGSASAEYLRGFIAGWFAADGHVDARAPAATIASAKRAHLEWLQRVAPQAGLAVSTRIRVLRSLSTFGPCEWFSLALSGSTLDSDFFVLREKRQRYRPARFTKYWKVTTIRPTYCTEHVFSLTVPDGGQFVIEGNILVGGQGCGSWHARAVSARRM
jgi:DNA primase